MSIGDPISDPIPPVGTAGTGYASQLVAFLSEVKTRLQAKVPLSSLLIGLLDMANNALANVSYLGLYNRAGTPTAPVGSLQNFNNNLWWVSSGGAFQVTNGASLNASSVKGIGGDYGSPNPAAANFVDADQTFRFYDNEPGSAWAWLRSRGIDIAAGATSAVKARIDFAGASSYTLTLPAAIPAQARMLTLDAAGDIQTDGVLGANQSITLSGTGRYKHGEFKNAWFPPMLFAGAGTWSYVDNGDGSNPMYTLGNNSRVKIPLLMTVGKRLKAVEVFVLGSVATVTYKVVKGDNTIPHTQTSPMTNVLRFTLNTPQDAQDNGYDNYLFLQISSNATGTVNLYNVVAVYDEV